LDVKQIRSVGTSGVGGNDRDVAGIGRVSDPVYGHFAKAVVAYSRVLGVANRYATALCIAVRVTVHLVVRDECFASVGAANALKADTGPTVVDHEVVVYPETVRMAGRVLAGVVAPDAVALRVVNVGVLDLDLVTRLQACADNAKSIRYEGISGELDAFEGPLGTENTS